MNEQRFTIQKASGMYLHLPIFDNGVEMADGDVCILLNEQQDQIIYWKHKVNGLLWILSQFDEEKVKELLKELEDE